MMTRFTVFAIWLAAMLAAPASAITLRRAPTALDPAKAYVLVEIGKLDDGMLPGTLVLARYDQATSDIAAPTPPPGGKIPRGGWAADNRVRFLQSAVTDGDRRLYIAQLEPGLWVVEGANDTAFSLGASTLRLEAGTVTDLGVIRVYSDFSDGEKRDTLTAGRLMRGALMGGIFGRTIPASVPKAIEVRVRTAGDIALPAIFASTAHPVEWAGQVGFGNHLGGLVNRMGGRKARPSSMSVGQPTSSEKSAQEKVSQNSEGNGTRAPQ